MLKTSLRIPRNIRQFAPRMDADLAPQNLPSEETLRSFGEVLLLEDNVVALHADGTASETGHTVSMPFSDDALAHWDQLAVPFHGKECRLKVKTARVVGPDGKAHKARHRVVPYNPNQEVIPNNPYRLSVVEFAPLRQGVVVEIEQTMDWWKTDPTGPYIWREFFVQTSAPCLRRRYTMAIDRAFELDIKLHNGAPAPEVEDIGSYRVYRWELTDAAGVQIDGNEPPIRDFLPVVEMTTIRSWKSVAEMHHADLFPQRTNKQKREHEQRLDALAEDLFAEADDDVAKLKAAYVYASDDVRYGRPPGEVNERQPRQAQTMLDDLRGDCKDKSQLMKQILSRVGVSSTLVLVATREQGLAEALPPGRFNHAILQCHAGGRAYWLDPSGGVYTFGDTPANVQGVQMMELYEDGSFKNGITPESQTDQHGSTWIMQGAFGEDGVLSFSAKSKLHGDRAAMARAAYRSQPENEAKDAFAAQLTAGRPGMQVLKFDMKGHDTLTESFRYGYRAEWKDAGIKVRDALQYSLMLRHPLFADNLTLRDTRLFPINGPLPIRILDQATITLPEGYELEGLPADVVDETPWCTYRLEFREEEGALAYEREVVALGGVIEPGEAYDRFREHCKTVLAAADTKVVIVKAGV